MENYIGIIDLGSNSARLVIYYLDQKGILYEIDNFKQVLRLGEHIENDGNIDQDGINKTIACMEQFKNVCITRQVAEIIGVATAAVRQAKNRQVLLQAIKDATDISFQVLSGEEEANYGYLAVVNSIDIQHAIAVDMGGGSTEIALINNRTKVNSVSFPFGALTLTKQFFKHAIPSGKELQQLREYLHRQFSTQPWLKEQSLPLVAIGGTARNLAKIHQRKNNYPLASVHTYTMGKNDLLEIFEWLAPLPVESRKKVDGLSRDRADIIHIGLFLFYTLMDWLKSDQLIFSGKGLRDGILFERLMKEKARPYLDDVAMYSTEQFMNRYQVNKKHAYHVCKLALKLFESFNQAGITEFGAREKKILKISTLLHDIGRSINIYNTSYHTFYLITNVLLMGVTQKERVMTAFVASYKNHKLIKEKIKKYHELITKDELTLIHQLGLILLLARTMDRSMSQMIKDIQLIKEGKQLFLICHGPQNLVEYQLMKDLSDKFYKVFNYQLVLQVKEK